MNTPPVQLDALVVGGGIAGLLALDALHAKGCRAWLVEHQALGCGQTIWSQGIIHGGLKYALGGVAGSAARSVSEMPQRWRRMLDGDGSPNLSAVAMRADACAIWTHRSASSLAGLLGAKLTLQTRPTKWSAADRPEALKGITGQVLRVAEPVLEPESLLAVLGTRHAPRLVQGSVSRIETRANHVDVQVSVAGEHVDVEARRLILLAGGGNANLRTLAGASGKSTQIRPLRMVLVRGPLPVLNGHCIRGAKPWLTITTVASDDSQRVWQVGGEVAERGATASEADTISLAAAQLSEALPEISFESTEWATYDAPRFEHATASGGRPDLPTVLDEGNLLTGWPTKLALAPLLSDDIAARISPTFTPLPAPAHWPRPTIATPPWMETCRWSNAPSDAPA